MTTLQKNLGTLPKSIPVSELTPKDFKAPIDVRWCSGCGSYSILSHIQRLFPTLGIPKENYVFVSGIGCSSRFPYYMDVYGFHSLHGRALAVASGMKIANPELSVWVATGDGDGMAIGGNHFIHAIRRNMNLKVLLFNNEIYSLTKGQASPTSPSGLKTKSSPFGVIERPFNPAQLALGSGATFVARTMDRDPKHLAYILQRAAQHKGIAFVEVYTNCVVYTDGIFEIFTDKQTKDDNTVFLEPNKPLIYGKNKDKAIVLDGLSPKSINIDGDGNNLLNYNEKDPLLAYSIASMSFEDDLPRPFGVFLDIERPTYEEGLHAQINDIIAQKGEGDINKLLRGEDYWEIN